jgi:hypothetical protein
MPGVLDTALCGKVNAFVSDLRQVGGSPGNPVSSTNKTARHDITEILLKVALNTITLTLEYVSFLIEKSLCQKCECYHYEKSNKNSPELDSNSQVR